MVIAHQVKKITNGEKKWDFVGKSSNFSRQDKVENSRSQVDGSGSDKFNEKRGLVDLKAKCCDGEKSSLVFSPLRYKTAPTTTGAAWSARSHETFAKCNSWKKSHRCAAQLSHSGYQLGAIRALNLKRRIDSSST